VVATVIPVNVNCFGNNDGSLQAIATGGHPPYTYAWSNGSTVQNMTNVPAGTYTATITDSYGCSATVTGTVFQPALLVANTLVTNESALGACDGAIDLTVTGGISPYAYAWSNAAVTEDITGLCSGTYSVTLTDSNGCDAFGSEGRR